MRAHCVAIVLFQIRHTESHTPNSRDLRTARTSLVATKCRAMPKTAPRDGAIHEVDTIIQCHGPCPSVDCQKTLLHDEVASSEILTCAAWMHVHVSGDVASYTGDAMLEWCYTYQLGASLKQAIPARRSCVMSPH